ncbi:MAG: chloramphenicol acetyltransferase [Chloroflexi bacterium]|nr:chloramphenicol acetyltransferase [Chloroflexota bacterium]
MRKLNLQTWARREHFRVFSGYDHPHFGLCANVDLTEFYPAVKERGVSFTVATVYVLAQAANAIPEFRYRLRGDEVVEHETVHPSTTILTDDNVFTFCSLGYVEPFGEFAARAAETMAYVRTHLTLEDEPGRDDLLFMTAVPWVSFTSVLHPMHLQPADCVPRLAWGKRFGEGPRLKMPLSVQAHHALMDGMHLGAFYTAVQEAFSHPDAVLGEA